MVFSHEHTQKICCKHCSPSPTQKHFHALAEIRTQDQDHDQKITIWCSRPLSYDPASETKTKTMVSNWKSFSLEYFWLKYLNKFSWIGSWFHCFFNKEWNWTIDNKMYVETKVKKVSKNVQLSLHQRQVI